MFFCSILGWFPVMGMKTPGANYSGFRSALDVLHHVALPTICLTFGSLASITRITRASMIDALNLDCIRTARAKGLSEKIVIYSHAWRNALIPMVSIIVGGFFGTISGAMILETMFGFKGMGLLFLNATRTADYDMIMFLEVIYTFLGLFSNLVIDLTYGIVDPRVRISK
jgi:peptide/nickel transport system permease protein